MCVRTYMLVQIQRLSTCLVACLPFSSIFSLFLWLHELASISATPKTEWREKEQIWYILSWSREIKLGFSIWFGFHGATLLRTQCSSIKLATNSWIIFWYMYVLYNWAAYFCCYLVWKWFSLSYKEKIIEKIGLEKICFPLNILSGLCLKSK